MRHFVRLGLRGLLLELGAVLMHLPGRLHYRWLLYRHGHKARRRPSQPDHDPSFFD